MSIVTYVGRATGSRYTPSGRTVRIDYAGGSTVTLTFDTAAEAGAYAATHGKRTHVRADHPFVDIAFGADQCCDCTLPRSAH